MTCFCGQPGTSKIHTPGYCLSYTTRSDVPPRTAYLLNFDALVEEDVEALKRNIAKVTDVDLYGEPDSP